MKCDSYQRLILWGILLCLSSSCGKFLGNLRRDLDDSDPAPDSAQTTSPTVGGNWMERGRMGTPTDRGVGHMDRAPANVSGNEGASWDAPAEADRNQRDQYRDLRNMPADSFVPTTSTVSNLEPETKRLYKNSARATKDDFVDQSQEEGSLWASSGQTNYYFTKNKVRSPGDIISIKIENDLYRDIATEIKRTLSPKEKAKEVELIQERNRAKVMAELNARRKDTIASSAAAAQRAQVEAPQAESTPVPGTNPSASPISEAPVAPAPVALSSPSAEEIDRLTPRASFDEVDIVPSLDFKVGETMMGEIIERYPNGNYKVRTVKRIPYKKGPPRIVNVVAIVKASDITEETDVINSNKLYEYRVDVAY